MDSSHGYKVTIGVVSCVLLIRKSIHSSYPESSFYFSLLLKNSVWLILQMLCQHQLEVVSWNKIASYLVLQHTASSIPLKYHISIISIAKLLKRQVWDLTSFDDNFRLSDFTIQTSLFRSRPHRIIFEHLTSFKFSLSYRKLNITGKASHGHLSV